MARVGQQVKSLDESDLLLPSATPTEQSTDDIKLSLNRIEELLNRGHQLLYGDEVGMSSEAGNGKDTVTGMEGDEPRATTQQEIAGISSSTKSSHMPARDAPHEPADDAEPSPLTPVSTTTASPRGTSVNVSPSAPPARKAYGGVGGGEPRRTRPRSRAGSVYQKPKSQEAKMEKELMSLSASARGARLNEIKKKTGKVLALEEGVDEDDKPQNVTIESLKDRIHRELEEYRRNGPLMKASRSAKPARKTNLPSTVPAPSSQSAPPGARSRFGFAATKTGTQSAVSKENRALAVSQPKRTAVRPRTNVVSSGYGKTRPATQPPTAATAPAARGQPSTAGARPSNGMRHLTTAAATRSRATTAPAHGKSTTTTAPARRKIGAGHDTNAYPGSTAPRATITKPRSSAARTQQAGGEDHAASTPQRVPVWERLYSHAAEQAVSFKRHREMQRQESRAMATSTAGKAHSHRPARPSQQRHHRYDDNRPVPAQESGATMEIFRPLALDAMRDSDLKNASTSMMRLSSNPRLSQSASMPRRSSGTTNVVPLVRGADEDPLFSIPSKAVVRKPGGRPSPPPPNGLSPIDRNGPKANSVSPVPAPPPQAAASRPTAAVTKSTTPNPCKRLQLEQPDADDDTTLLDDECDDNQEKSTQSVPQFVRPLDLRGIKK